MKNCELCGRRARMHCESDKASLCWECDEKVHSANFLVAKHVRCLLCHVCQSPTPWKASGSKLGPTVSVCDSCVESCNKGRQEVSCRGVREESQGDVDSVDEDDDDDVADDEEEDEEESDDEDEEEDEDGENQVVPWSCDPPPPAASSSSSGEESTSRYGADLDRRLANKRRRENGDLASYSDDEIECASSRFIPGAVAEDEVVASSSTTERPLKLRRAVVTETDQSTAKNEEKYGRLKTESNPAVVIHALNGLQKSAVTESNAAATISGIWKLSRYQSG